jgi:hypothetical protein
MFKRKFGCCTRKTFNRFTKKTAALGTAHIIRKVLQCENWSLRSEDHDWFKKSTGEKRPVTRDNKNNKNNKNNNIIIIIIFYYRILSIAKWPTNETTQRTKTTNEEK